MAFSAFRDTAPEELQRHLVRSCAEHGLPTEPIRPAPLKGSDRTDVFIFAPQNGWTVVQWPQYFEAVDLALCLSLSRRLEALVSTNGVHCDDLWRHALIQCGVVLDRFANRPDYFCDSDEEGRALRERYKGSARAIARACGVDPKGVAPYLRHLSDKDILPRVWPDDEYEPGDPWAFKDFWKRLGILFPNPGSCAVGLRLPENAWQKLPGSEGEL